MSFHTTRRAFIIGVLSVLTVASTTAPALAKGPSVKKATFAKNITKDFKAQNPTTNFDGKETVYLLLEFGGRPKKGKVESIWKFGAGGEIARATVDFAAANSGFTFGGNTFVKFNLTLDPKSPLPVGPYKVDVTVDGAAAGSYPWKVIPPKGAGPTKLGKVVLATGTDADYKPTGIATTFKKTDSVNLVFNGSFGLGSWLQATWKVAGKVDDEGTRSLTLEENVTDIYGTFNYLPKGGWPVGKHSVELMVDGVVAGNYSFTVK
jgi:hypothetical protein